MQHVAGSKQQAASSDSQAYRGVRYLSVRHRNAELRAWGAPFMMRWTWPVLLSCRRGRGGLIAVLRTRGFEALGLNHWGLDHWGLDRLLQEHSRTAQSSRLGLGRANLPAQQLRHITTFQLLLPTLTNATVYLSVGLKGMNLAMAYSSHSVSLRQGWAAGMVSQAGAS